jgi:hypothetical protein
MDFADVAQLIPKHASESYTLQKDIKIGCTFCEKKSLSGNVLSHVSD